MAERARLAYEQWFASYPSEHKSDLLGRFVSKDDGQHLAAHFELMLHHLLRSLGCDVEIHPHVIEASKRPDFLVHCANSSFYLEALSISPALEERRITTHERQVLEWVHNHNGRGHTLFLQADGELKQPIRRSQVIEGLDRLLSLELSQSETNKEDHQKLADRKSIDMSDGDWTLKVELWLPDGSRHSGGGAIVLPSVSTDFTRLPIVAKKIAKKARKKQLGSLDLPLIVATRVFDQAFDSNERAAEVIFGNALYRPESPESMHFSPSNTPGIWFDASGRPSLRNLRAVWIFEGAYTAFWKPAGLGTRLFLNPHGHSELPAELLEFPRAYHKEPTIEWIDGVDANEMLGLPDIRSDDLFQPSTSETTG